MAATRDQQFTDYVRARRSQLRRTAYLVSGDWHLAEDIVQTALTKLYNAWPRVYRSGNMDGFARQIIVNCAIDEKRRPWRRERQNLDGVERPATPTLSVEDRASIVAAVAKLPLGQRRVIALRYFWDLSVEETASDLGCSTGNVKSQAHAALNRLQHLLSSDLLLSEGTTS
ncbi:MAG: SigE family RNA polymerase sigma factor [Nocardioides sp.]